MRTSFSTTKMSVSLLAAILFALTLGVHAGAVHPAMAKEIEKKQNKGPNPAALGAMLKAPQSTVPQSTSNLAVLQAELKTALSQIKPTLYQPPKEGQATQTQAESAPLAGLKIMNRFWPKFHTQAEKDQAFLLFRKYYTRWVSGAGPENLTMQFDMEKLMGDGTYFEDQRKLAWQQGYDLAFEEGDIYVMASPRFLLQHFEKRISPDLVTFFQHQAKEDDTGFTNDAALVIGWDDVRLRIAQWDQFLQQYPSSLMRKEAERTQQGYAYVYLHGLDNTPLYEQNWKTLEEKVSLAPEIKASYERFLNENESSRYYPQVARFYEVLKAHHFKFTVDPNLDYRGQFYDHEFPIDNTPIEETDSLDD